MYSVLSVFPWNNNSEMICLVSAGRHALACCLSALILMGWFLVSCLYQFGKDKNPLKCYTSSKCIMRLHGHYLNGCSDVPQLAKTQTVGGVLEESQRFMWKAGKPLQASVNNSAVWSDALSADYALVSVGSKQENEFHSTTQPLCIIKMVSLESVQPCWKFGHLCHWCLDTTGALIRAWILQ